MEHEVTGKTNKQNKIMIIFHVFLSSFLTQTFCIPDEMNHHLSDSKATYVLGMDTNISLLRETARKYQTVKVGK